jgi:hypothetical protein
MEEEVKLVAAPILDWESEIGCDALSLMKSTAMMMPIE